MIVYWQPVLFIECLGFTSFVIFGFLYLIDRLLNQKLYPYSARISAIGLTIFIWTIYLEKYNLI